MGRFSKAAAADWLAERGFQWIPNSNYEQELRDREALLEERMLAPSGSRKARDLPVPKGWWRNPTHQCQHCAESSQDCMMRSLELIDERRGGGVKFSRCRACEAKSSKTACSHCGKSTSRQHHPISACPTMWIASDLKYSRSESRSIRLLLWETVPEHLRPAADASGRLPLQGVDNTYEDISGILEEPMPEVEFGREDQHIPSTQSRAASPISESIHSINEIGDLGFTPDEINVDLSYPPFTRGRASSPLAVNGPPSTTLEEAPVPAVANKAALGNLATTWDVLIFSSQLVQELQKQPFARRVGLCLASASQYLLAFQANRKDITTLLTLTDYINICEILHLLTNIPTLSWNRNAQMTWARMLNLFKSCEEHLWQRWENRQDDSSEHVTGIEAVRERMIALYRTL